MDFSPPLGLFVTVPSKDHISSSKDDLREKTRFLGSEPALGRLAASPCLPKRKLNSKLNAGSDPADRARMSAWASGQDDCGSTAEHISMSAKEG